MTEQSICAALPGWGGCLMWRRWIFRRTSIAARSWAKAEAEREHAEADKRRRLELKLKTYGITKEEK